MGNILTPGVDGEAFLRHGMKNGYSMQANLVPAAVVNGVAEELEQAGYLEDYVELKRTAEFESRGMKFASLLHGTLSRLVKVVEESRGELLTHFSVRVFEPGLHGTTIHRNDESIGPWAIGITLRGEAPFNVYRQSQLEPGRIQKLYGDGLDPVPMESMNTSAGSAWTLYTRYEQIPHSSGIVNSDMQRELLILYGTQYNMY